MLLLPYDSNPSLDRHLAHHTRYCLPWVAQQTFRVRHIQQNSHQIDWPFRPRPHYCPIAWPRTTPNHLGVAQKRVPFEQIRHHHQEDLWRAQVAGQQLLQSQEISVGNQFVRNGAGEPLRGGQTPTVRPILECCGVPVRAETVPILPDTIGCGYFPRPQLQQRLLPQNPQSPIATPVRRDNPTAHPDIPTHQQVLVRTVEPEVHRSAGPGGWVFQLARHYQRHLLAGGVPLAQN